MAIDKIITLTTSGDQDSSSQAFYSNWYADSTNGVVPVFSQSLPMYSTIGGTKDYYHQNPLSIFTNLSRPFIRYTFTGNTSAITQVKMIVHNIYKVDYESFKNFAINQPTTAVDKNIASENAVSNLQSNYDQKSKSKLGGNPTIEFSRAYGQPLQSEQAQLLQPLLTTPLVTFTASTTGITGLVYDFYPDQYVKKLGQFKQDLFEDKAQYFIETQFFFEINKGLNYSTYSTYVDGQLVEQPWNNIVQFSTTDETHTINAGDFKGLQVKGNYFTYFVVPEKPQIEYPVVEGVLSTFAPEFFWSKGEGSDEYLIQISYNTGNTGFTGTLFNYPISKTEDNKHVARSTTKSSDTEFMSDKVIRSASIPLKGNTSSFIYRIGNVNSEVNIFGVRQYVVTFSDYKTAITQAAPVKTYVKVQSDSPYVGDIAEFTTPASLDSETPFEEFILSGTVSGSTVTGATMQLIYPNLSYVTTTTDLSGYYEFANLESGTYTLNTFYRGYQDNTQTFSLTGDTTLNFKIKLLWSNAYDTWGKMAGENYFL